MFKRIGNPVVVFDCEYVPCLATGRRVYHLPETLPEAEVLAHLYAEAGATAAKPEPILKQFFYRLVSIAYLARTLTPSGVKLRLVNIEAASERELIEKFLQAIGKRKPQLVGYASGLFDLPVLFQRALVTQAAIGTFCERPEKPWEGPDYFSEFGDSHIDLMNVITPKGRKPKLAEIALACGIPGKLGMDGAAVAEAWLQGREQEVRNYNECDVLTTYLLWLRLAFMGGHLDGPAYSAEQAALGQLLDEHIQAGAAHLAVFRAEWERLDPLVKTTPLNHASQPLAA